MISGDQHRMGGGFSGSTGELQIGSFFSSNNTDGCSESDSGGIVNKIRKLFSTRH